MKKVVMVTPGIGIRYGGGRTRLVEILSVLLSLNGYRVLIVSKFPTMDKIHYSFNNIDIVSHGFYSNIKKMDYIMEIVNQYNLYKILLDNSDADILHLHIPLYGFGIPPKYRVLNFRGWVNAAERFKKAKIILHFHGSFYNVQDPYINLNYIKEITSINADHLIVLSRRDKKLLDKYTRHLGLDLPITTIYNPALPSFFKVGEKGINEDTLNRILYAGGSNPDKGYNIASRLSRLLDSRITMIGPGLRRIEWFEMPSLMSEHGIVLMPTYREGLPLLLLESMASGRVVISSRVGGIAEIIKDGVNGFLCPAGDVECFKNKIEFVVGNMDYARRVGRNAYKTALEEFSLRRFLESITSIYG